MLTRKQYDLLVFIHERIQLSGVSPSFDEMKDALELKSKSGIHRLITALEERGYVRRLAHKARALEVVKLPENMAQREAASTAPPNAPPEPQTRAPSPPPKRGEGPRLTVVDGGEPPSRRVGVGPAELAQTPGAESVPVIGRIAAGTPIEALQQDMARVAAPASMISAGADHFALEVVGDSMIEAGIHDGDTVVIRRQEDAQNGEIVVALVDGEEATLKRLRKRGGAIALEAANPAFETRVYGSERVRVQGRLVGLIRAY